MSGLGWGGVLRGGNANNGSNAGFVYVNTNNAASNANANIGSFEGRKMSIEDLFNIPIIINAFKIEESKFTGKNKSNNRLQLSIEIKDEKYITFTGSDTLIEMIKKVPEDEFPFETVIKKKEKRFEFT